MTALAGRRGWLAAAGLIVAACMGAFFGVLGNGFVWDDHTFILNNLVLDDLRNAPLIFTNGDTVGIAGYGTPYYRPLTTLTFAVDKALWGTNPAGFHATNLLLHIGVCLLLFTVCRRMTSHPAAALAATLLFAVHPANAEPVAFISARADLLCALFILASFLFFLKALDEGERRHLFLASLLCFAAALFSKIIALLLPILILMHLLWMAPRKPGRFRLLIPYAVGAGVFMAVRAAVLDMHIWVNAPLADRVATAGASLLLQVRHAILPLGLEIFYGRALASSFSSPAVIGGWAVVLCLAGLSIWAIRKMPLAALGSAMFFGALIPTSGLFMTMAPAPLADRYLYLPLTGLALVVAAVGDRLPEWKRPSRRRSLAAAAAVTFLVVLGMGVSAARVPSWREEMVFWEHANRDGSDNYAALMGLGGAYSIAGRADEAERVFHRVGQKYGHENIDLQNHLARIAFLRGDFIGAGKLAKKALELDPRSSWSMLLLADCYYRTGNRRVAVAILAEARQLDPYNGEIQSMMDHLVRERLAEEWAPSLPSEGQEAHAEEIARGRD